jgi:hypothetical protein
LQSGFDRAALPKTPSSDIQLAFSRGIIAATAGIQAGSAEACCAGDCPTSAACSVARFEHAAVVCESGVEAASGLVRHSFLPERAG